MRAVKVLRIAGVAAAVVAMAPPAEAELASPAERAVRGALTQWQADFNDGKADAVCGLFAPDLRYDYRGYPERGFEEVCGLLQESLNDRNKSFNYDLQIKEVIVSGDMAAVRLVWTLTIKRPGDIAGTITAEPGLDIFRKQRDGSWKIVRYLAYEE